MKSQIAPYLMMAVGAVLALIFAAGPLASSPVHQVFFWGSLLLLAFGVVMRRTSSRKDALSGFAEGEVQQAHAALELLRHALEQAQADCISIEDMPEFHRLVYRMTQPPVRDFLEHRQALLDAYGFGPFAELMIRFARVERAINRTLSASADGVEAEARSCLEIASQRMEDCLAAYAATGASHECN